MKMYLLLLISVSFCVPVTLCAQELRNNSVPTTASIGDSTESAQIRQLNAKYFSAGAVVGDPLGITMKYLLGSGRAIDVSFGPDYFGSPRLQVDYVWLFDWFRSSSVREYAGPGLAVAFAKGIKPFYSHEPFPESFTSIEDNGFGVGARSIVGLSYRAPKSSFEYYIETGVMVSFARYFDPDLDGAIGFRYRI